VAHSDTILNYLNQQPNSARSVREIQKLLALDKAQARKLLALMTDEGLLVEVRKGIFMLASARTEKAKAAAQPRAYSAKLQVHPAGFGFAIAEETASRPDLYIPKGYLGGAWHGDLVLVETRPPGRDRRAWGLVTAIRERVRSSLTGRLFFKKGFAWINPDDERMPKVALKPDGLEGLEAGARLLVQLFFPDPGARGSKEPYGQMLEYLGQGNTPEVETQAVIAKYELPKVFSPEALDQAEQIPPLIPTGELERRQDFRALTVMTIDGVDAKDFDDAIHVEVLPNGNLRVGIHIADVSFYVKEQSPLDRDAYERGTSVYMPGKVLPMLPERLSNGVCSLVPGEDRLVLSVLAELSPKGNLKGYSFSEGVIHSKARLTYTEVEEFIAGKPLAKRHKGLSDDLRRLYELTRALKAKRLEGGAIDFNFPEVRIEIDHNGEIGLIPQTEPEARSLIEELMLLANRIVAKHLSERGIPALFRVHEDPTGQAYKKLAQSLGRLGYALPSEPSPKALQAVLRKAKDKPEAPVVSTLLLRSLKLARYAHENLGHFGLAAEHYLHFTSPIRRYPDLVVHRVLRAAMSKKLTPKRKATWAEAFPGMADHTSARERAAEGAERELTKYYGCLWAEARLGQTFGGTVSGVTNFGVFVTLPGGVEGLVRLSALDDYYELHEETLTLQATRSGQIIRIGELMNVRIERVEVSSRQIDLLPQEVAQPPKAGGKGGKASLRVSKSDPKPKRDSGSVRKRNDPMQSNKRRVVGTPDRKNHYDKPVKVTHSRLYFGEWNGEVGQDEPVWPKRSFSPNQMSRPSQNATKPNPSATRPGQTATRATQSSPTKPAQPNAFRPAQAAQEPRQDRVRRKSRSRYRG
jgi:ribonuclease R